MSDESNASDKVDDFKNMKVADLKEKLRSRGLPVTGNKAQLAMRLQNDLNEAKDVESESWSEKEMMDSLDKEEIHTPDPLLEDFSLTAEKDLVQDQPTKSIDSTTNSNPASIPLKKRAVAQAAADNVKVEKKIVLKRNNIPTPVITAPKSPVPSKTINVITVNKSDTNSSEKTDDEVSESEASKERKSVIRLAREPVKSLSEGEKFVRRAERFKTSTDKDAPESKNKISSLPSSHAAKVISSTDLSSLETLKKRAERFGQSVSSVMKKMEDEQRILKRKSKFGNITAGNGITSAEEQEKKKRRAERFGI